MKNAGLNSFIIPLDRRSDNVPHFRECLAAQDQRWQLSYGETGMMQLGSFARRLLRRRLGICETRDLFQETRDQAAQVLAGVLCAEE